MATPHLSLLLECICQITVSIWEVRLKFYGSAVSINCQLHQAAITVTSLTTLSS